MKTLSLSTLTFGALLVLASCGGGTGGTGASEPVVSRGVMEKGSIILNGVHFDDSTATIVIDDSAGTSAQLADGMHVTVRGRINDDRFTGTAQQVEVENEVRGTVQARDLTLNPPTITVVNQTVFVPYNAILANFSALSQLNVGASVVEVHGDRNTTDGSIRASRVELISSPSADSDELRGTISGAPGATTFVLRNGANDVTVDYTSKPATITPANATLSTGLLVEVHGSFSAGTFVATRVDVEDLEDQQFEHSAGEKLEVEGLISGCATPCSGTNESFLVGTRKVETNSATRVVGGMRVDLIDNTKVEAEGHNFNTTTGALIAEKIEFKRSVVRVQGVVTMSPGGSTFTLDVAGMAVNLEADDFTKGAVPPVDLLTCVQVRGERKLPSASLIVTASEITNCSNSGRPVIQAPVELESGTMLTLLDFPINVASPTDNPPYVGSSGESIFDTQQFLAQVTAAATVSGVSVPGTLVKVIFNSPANTVRQVEIED